MKDEYRVTNLYYKDIETGTESKKSIATFVRACSVHHEQEKYWSDSRILIKVTITIHNGFQGKIEKDVTTKFLKFYNDKRHKRIEINIL